MLPVAEVKLPPLPVPPPTVISVALKLADGDPDAVVALADVAG